MIKAATALAEDTVQRFGLGSQGELRARLGASYRSKVYPTTDLSEVIAQPGYTLVNAGLIWQVTKQLSYSLQGTNLTDVDEETVNDDGIVTTRRQFGPTYMLNVNYAFY